MQVSVETLAGLERKLVIDIPASDVEQEIAKRLDQVSRTARIDGFRKGKIPMRVIKQRYGQGVRQEVLGEQMQQGFIKAVTQEKMNPAGMPSVEPIVDEEGKDFQFAATFEIYPEVSVSGLENISVEKFATEVTDADLDNMIDILRKQQAKFAVSEAAAKDGDKVKVDFDGYVDGEAFEGGKAEGYDLTLGSKSMIPGFEDQIVGMKAGDEATIKVTFPAEYQSEALAGKDAEFKIKVHQVEASELPELNQEFFKLFGVESEDVESFRKDVRGNMERELKQAIQRNTKNQALEGLLEQNNIDVPAALVDQEIQSAMLWSGAVSQAKLDFANAEFDVVKNFKPFEGTRWDMAWVVKTEEKGLLEFINSSFDEMLESGEIQQIVERYGVPFFPPLNRN